MVGTQHLNDYSGFALELLRFKRCNPDGTVATAQRTLGFVGNINITDILDSQRRGSITIKVDSQERETRAIDFSDANSDNLTPSAAAAALNEAAFTGVEFSVDGATGRLMLSAVSPSVEDLQIRSVLAGALNFGGCRKNMGLGCYWILFDSSQAIDASNPPDKKDKETVEQESAQGEVKEMNIPARYLGVSPTITLMYQNNEFKQLIQGGIYYPATLNSPERYENPLSNERYNPLFTMEKYVPLYASGSVSIEDNKFIKRLVYYAGTGSADEVGSGAKAWETYPYTLSFREYRDENGKRHSVPLEEKLSLSQWEAMDIYSRVIDDT
jgi:hypothetical protein